MATSKSAWTRAESGAAAIFGARRRVLSGSANRVDIDGDDSTHPRLWIESKLRVSHAAWSLWRATRDAAVKCGRVPILALREKHKQGTLIVCHSSHLRAMVVEWLVAQGRDTLLEIEAEVRAMRSTDAGEDT